MEPEPTLQARLDQITTTTRALVQPERLAIVDTAVGELMASGIESRVLRVGATAPAFTLPDARSGRPVRSEDLLALGPLVVTFFRGRWCPYCMTALEAWQAALPQLRARGALLVAVSPQTPRQNEFAAGAHSLQFPVLSDAGCQVAAAFGLAHTVPEPLRKHYRSILVNIPMVNGEDSWRLPLPGTFLLKPERDEAGLVRGIVTFAEAQADHRVRCDPREVLAALG